MVLQGNVESKKPRNSSKGENSRAGENQAKAAADDGGSEAGGSEEAKAQSQGQAPAEAVMVPGQPVTLPADWASHGTIALVSHSGMGGITVIHTEMPPGTQLQPIVAAGTSVISLDGATIQVPFSLPASMAHAITPMSTVVTAPVTTTTTATSDSLDASMAMALTELSEGRVALRTECVLEAAVSQTLLAPEVGGEGAGPPAVPPCGEQFATGQAEASPSDQPLNTDEASANEHKDSSEAQEV